MASIGATSTGILATTQVECGHGKILQVQDNHVHLTPVRETLQTDTELLTGGYNVCVLLTNTGPTEAVVSIDIHLADWFTEPWCRLPLRLPYWSRAGSDLKWSEADPAQRHDEQTVFLTIPIGVSKTVVVSSIPHYPYSDCVRAMSVLAEQSRGEARLVELGKTPQGRSIHSLEIGRGSERVVVFGAFRPAEPSAWGVLGMAKGILHDDRSSRSGRSGGSRGAGLRELAKSFTICLVPQPNPDGIVAGRCLGNSLGQSLYYDWNRPVNERSREGQLLWDYLSAGPLAMAGQFDFAPVTTRLSDWPRPLSVDIYNPVSVELHHRLAERSGELGSIAKDRREPAQQQIVHHAAAEWDCAAFAYRFVGSTTTPERAEHRARQVLETALSTYLENKR